MSVIKSMKEVAKALQREHESTTFEILNVPVAGGRWRLITRRDTGQLDRIRVLSRILAEKRSYRTAILARLKLYGAHRIGELKPAYYSKFEAFLKALEYEAFN